MFVLSNEFYLPSARVEVRTVRSPGYDVQYDTTITVLDADGSKLSVETITHRYPYDAPTRAQERAAAQHRQLERSFRAITGTLREAHVLTGPTAVGRPIKNVEGDEFQKWSESGTTYWTVKSAKSGANYRIARNADKAIACSCRGSVFHGYCRHQDFIRNNNLL